MKLGIRLMHQFGVSESLIGDVVERSRTQSALWFLRQVVFAVAARAVHDIADHTWFAMQTLATAWIVGFLFEMVVGELVGALVGALANSDAGYALLISPWGWWHWPEVTIHCLSNAVLGMVLMRLRPRHSAAALILWMTSPLPFATFFAWSRVRMLNAGVAGGWRGFPADWVGWGGHHPPAFIHTFQFVMLVHFLVYSVAAPICVLLGGLWACRRAQSVVTS
jgi:hypothetical protein